MPVSKRLRYEVLQRDYYRCRYCGRTAPDVKLTIDHLVPVSLGGEDKPENLVTACSDCNAGKSSSTVQPGMIAKVSYDALRWSAAMRRAGDVQRARLQELRAYIDLFDSTWCDWTIKATGAHVERPDNWRDSIENLLAAGLDIYSICDAVDIAMRKQGLLQSNVFRYFAGVAWSRVREQRELATEILNSETSDDPLVEDSGE